MPSEQRTWVPHVEFHEEPIHEVSGEWMVPLSSLTQALQRADVLEAELERGHDAYVEKRERAEKAEQERDELVIACEQWKREVEAQRSENERLTRPTDEQVERMQKLRAEDRKAHRKALQQRDELREALRELLNWAANIEGEGRLRRSEAIALIALARAALNPKEDSDDG